MPPNVPKPLFQLPTSDVKGVFFDIDDTFTTDGKIAREAFSAIWDLKDAGKVVVPITGRPAGWCDHIARMWPVDAVVGENGAFYFMMRGGKMTKKYTADTASRADFRRRLEEILREVLSEVNGAAVSSDHDYREFDLSIDFCEDVARLSGTDIDRIVAIYKKHGANTKISSIHVNGWFGDYDKLTTAKLFVRNELGLDLDADNDEFVFCGDSPNDEPMFRFFKKSVGVANVMEFMERLTVFPQYITTKRSGEGFAELAKKILGD